MNKKSINYQNYVIESLKNSEEATVYLNAALKDEDIKVFLVALHNVIRAQGGISKLAKKIHKNRTTLYKALSKEGNPSLKNIREILSAIDMYFTIAPND